MIVLFAIILLLLASSGLGALAKAMRNSADAANRSMDSGNRVKAGFQLLPGLIVAGLIVYAIVTILRG